MVKNTQGGNKSKSMARKNISSTGERRALRLPSCDLELVGVVTQLLGHGMFYVSCHNGIQLLGRIRNKFRGRSKRDNHLSKDSFVLVGLRDWEAPDFKECDLLEVFDSHDASSLFSIFPSLSDIVKPTTDDSIISFSNHTQHEHALDLSNNTISSSFDIIIDDI